MKKELLLVGAGHAHLLTFRNLHRFVALGHRVTVVSPSSYYYYSGTGPGVLSGIYSPSEGRIAVRRLVELRGAAFIEDRVVAIEPDQGGVVLAGGRKLPFDIASFNIGSRIPIDGFRTFEGVVVRAKPIENFVEARRRLTELLREKRRLSLVVVGGGPAGLEIAGNMWRLVRSSGTAATITLIAGGRLMRRFPERLRALAKASLEDRGIRILEDRRVVALEEGFAVLEDGQRLALDFGMVASGVQLSPLFQEAGLPVDEDLGLRVNEYLQCPACEAIFAGGDCVSFQPEPLAKVGVVAYRQNPVLYRNLLAALSGQGTLEPFRPDPVYSLMFNLGDGTALWWRSSPDALGPAGPADAGRAAAGPQGRLPRGRPLRDRLPRGRLPRGRPLPRSQPPLDRPKRRFSLSSRIYLTWKGRVPFLVKNGIDRRFMRSYRRAETRLG